MEEEVDRPAMELLLRMLEKRYKTVEERDRGGQGKGEIREVNRDGEMGNFMKVHVHVHGHHCHGSIIFSEPLRLLYMCMSLIVCVIA